MSAPRPRENPISSAPKKTATAKEKTTTITVSLMVSWRVGQLTRLSSRYDSAKYAFIFAPIVL